MKKRIILSFIIAIAIISITGCGSKKDEWEKMFQVSELEYEEDYIVGDIKNLTDKYYDIKIIIESKNGSIKDDNYCYETIKPNEKREFKCLATKLNENYSNKIKDITFEELEIPDKTTKNGSTISIDELKYYYEKVYDAHTLSMTGFSFNRDVDNNDYPYIKEITYSGDEIKIYYPIYYNNSLITTTSIYEVRTGNLKDFFVIMDDSDKELQTKVETKISILYYFTDNHFNTIKIGQAIKEPVEDGKCYKVDNWCFSKYVSNGIVSYVASGR